MTVGDEAWVAAIAHHLAALIDGVRQRLLLYLEFADGWSGGSLFVDEGNRIASLSLQRDLWGRIYHDWDELKDGKRWSVMKLMLAADGTFTARFLFPDEIDVGEINLDNRREIAAAREAFGDKPIHYPPAPPHSFDLTEESYGLEHPLG